MKKILILIIFMFFSCDLTENRFITIKNNSKDNIFCFISKIDLNNIKSIAEMNSIAEIKKDEFAFLIPTVRGKWESYLDKCENNKARVYVVIKDSVDKYGWNNIYIKNIYAKKYLFSISDLEKINFEINYEN